MEKMKQTLMNRKMLCLSILLLVLAVVIARVQPNVASDAGRVFLGRMYPCLFLVPAAILFGKFALGWLKELGYEKRTCIQIVVFCLSVCVAGLLLIYLYFKNEQDIKVYDFSTYWINAMASRDIIGSSVNEYLNVLINSFTLDYNWLPSFFLIPFIHLFGASYTVYCQAIFVVYYMPAAVLMTILALRMTALIRKSPFDISVFAVCLVAFVSCPLLLWPLMHGYLDVIGVLVTAVLLNYSMKWDGVDFSAKRNLTMTAISVLLLLSRRWYAYYILGFFVMFGVVSGVKILVGRQRIGKQIGMIIVNFGMIASTAIVAILIINPSIINVYLTDYGDIYSAFRSKPWWEDIRDAVSNLGYLGSVVSLFGALLMLRNKESRCIGARVMAAACMATAMFLSVQSLGFHQLYLLSPTVVVFIQVFMASSLQELGRKTSRLCSICLMAVLTLNLFFAYAPELGAAAYFARPVATAIRSYPVQNPHVSTYQDIVNDLKEKTAGKAASVYMIGEGDINPDYLHRVNLPEEQDAAPFVMTNCVADTRDGFPSQLFTADYILVVDPFMTDFTAIQQVSYQAYDMLLNDPVVAEYYEIDTRYAFGEDDLIVFKKTKDADHTLVNILRDRLQIFYPDNAFVYQPDYFLSLAEFDDTLTEYDYYGSILTFEKEAEHDIQFVVNDTMDYNTLSLELNAGIQGLVMVAENQDGELSRQDIAAYETGLYTFDITGSDYVQISVQDADGSRESTGQLQVYLQNTNLE